jgi:hypothetical protein
MNRTPAMRGRSHRVLVLLAVLVVALGALGATAAVGAALDTTFMSASASSTTVTWGGYSIIKGVLTDTTEGSDPVGGQYVLLQYSATGAPFPAPWYSLANITTDATQAAAGKYVGIAYPTKLTYYHFWFQGSPSTGLGATVSKRLTINVKPALGVPSAPSSAKANASFKVSGSLKPQFPAGEKTVTIKAVRYNGSTWVAYKTYKATNADNGSFTKYSLTLKISSKGKYRFSASTAATAATPFYSAASTGNSGTVTIK